MEVSPVCKAVATRNTKIFAMGIIFLWIIAYVVGIIFDNPKSFLIWYITLAVIGILWILWYLFTTLKCYRGD